ncbi:MAG: sugar phosphate isomerase/epimerase [Armatimonadetes bacterium]|nr:sugar phosphate isomerase/epimerase [Armatimonadota bacterium]MDW8121557.1 sugar phosphate isomerase/epimerase family protein [Armatimonadota bacterium]
MKLACQDGLVPGDSLEEKLDRLAAWGYEGVEFWGSDWLVENAETVRQKVEKAGLTVSTVCAGYRGSLLDPDPSVRQQAQKDIEARLRAAGQLGAVGLIFVPIFGGPRLPDLSPFRSALQLEDELLLLYLERLAPVAEREHTLLLLEPLNRYETHYLRRVEQAVALCEKVQAPGIAVMADLFHMSIEEASLPDAIRAGGRWIRHVHLADSNRLLPGWGHTDFRSAFAALKEIGFTDFMALECGVPGDPRETLPQAASFLRSQMT